MHIGGRHIYIRAIEVFTLTKECMIDTATLFFLTIDPIEAASSIFRILLFAIYPKTHKQIV